MSTPAKGADARLIAAAPELLAALEKLLRAVDRMPSNSADGIADEARAVIAKVKGERLDSTTTGGTAP